MRAWPALVACFLLGGCVDTDGPDGGAMLPDCPVPSARQIPALGATYAPGTDPRERFDTLLAFPNQTWPHIDSFTTPTGWVFGRQNLNYANATSSIVRLSADPIVEGGDPTEPSNVRAEHGLLEVTWTDESFVADACRISETGTASWILAPPAIGDKPAPGRGAHVHAAGFWENGTLFWTNIGEIHASDWPRAGWYQWGGGKSLPVYVYAAAADERPAHWNPPPDPVTGTQPWAYFTTIKGFNDALKDTSTNTGRVVHIAPEDAYTRAGNEDHDLYGDALVFYIVVEAVVDAPCADTLPTRDACRVPVAPGAPLA